MPSNSKDIGSTNGTASEVSDDLWAMVLRGVDCSGYLTTRMRIKTTLPPAASTANNNETNQYFYHSDHLGSSSFVSDAIGYATQHLQYLPYGETFVDQHGAFDSRYTFSAKEKDDETQYSYFGARYYDSDLSVWLSVDPMADVAPNESPYSYAGNNPVCFKDYFGYFKIRVDAVDENGKQVDIKRYEQLIKNMNNYVNNNPELLQVLSEQSGLSIEQVQEFIQYGSGPTLAISNEYRLYPAQVSDEDFNKGEIYISYSDLKYFEEIDSRNTDELSVYTMAWAITTLHELIHFGDRMTNNGSVTGYRNNGKMVYGKQDYGKPFAYFSDFDKKSRLGDCRATIQLNQNYYNVNFGFTFGGIIDENGQKSILHNEDTKSAIEIFNTDVN